MKPLRTQYLLSVPVLLGCALCGSDSAAQPFRVNWIGAAGVEGLWDAGEAGNGEGDNWLTTEEPASNFQPDEGFQEYGSISNGGIAVLDATTSPVTPVDVRLAEDGGSTGSLVIKDGGSITVTDTITTNMNQGWIRNGVHANGVGVLTLHDAIGAVTVDGYGQNSVSTLNVEIDGPTFNPVVVKEQIQLGGTLQVSGSLASAGAGSSWTLFDGSADGIGVFGQFSQVVNNSDYSLLDGQSFTVSTAESEVTLGIRQQLVLRVDPYAGTAVLSNPSGSGVDFDVTGYVMSVSNGAVNEGQWSSFSDDAAGWVETATANQLAETNATGMATLTDGASQDFGAPLSINTNQPIGTNLLQSVSFQYSTADNVIENAVVVLEGNRQNNLVLVVDPVDGSAMLQNQSSQSVDLTGYVVRSESGALLPGFSDLEGQGVAGWDVVAETANALSELNAVGMSTLGVGATLDLGVVWDLSEEDLTLQYSTAGLTTAFGAVYFGDLADISPNVLPGDFNADGVVDAADYTIWRDNLDGDSSVLNGNGSGAPTVVAADYSLWRANYGATTAPSAGSAAPEPGSILLFAAGVVATAARGRLRIA
ncbi:hypothetical protein KOR34_02670 [Posidoniimonas corsicana]|uniref:PEP-CTERM protein-sorting domain-containing protein n=1 Tax=Posidoniimonas corsicana TaxID=1938618 RepID=A0A5C5V9T1_9BACT|nr:hypothetical protein [Posidoniimonas corsicana]TWT35376.1 hypothetical protein KOR34_02670 [Posidoniimonas corsicana]